MGMVRWVRDDLALADTKDSIECGLVFRALSCDGQVACLQPSPGLQATSHSYVELMYALGLAPPHRSNLTIQELRQIHVCRQNQVLCACELSQ